MENVAHVRTQTHTPEPWEYEDGSDLGRANCVYSRTDGRLIADFSDAASGIEDEDERAANARRAAACVNALAGMPTDQVEDHVEARRLLVSALARAGIGELIAKPNVRELLDTARAFLDAALRDNVLSAAALEDGMKLQTALVPFEVRS